jgi:hypothetical protein
MFHVPFDDDELGLIIDYVLASYRVYPGASF